MRRRFALIWRAFVGVLPGSPLPIRLRQTLLGGVVLTLAAMIGAELSFAPTFHADMMSCIDGAKPAYSVVSSWKSGCNERWERQCKQLHTDELTRTRAACTLMQLEQTKPKGSLEHAQLRSDIEYLETIKASIPATGSDRHGLWRWAGLAIFLSSCSLGGYALLRHMQTVGLDVGERLRGWKGPFVGMLAYSNLVGLTATIYPDLLQATALTWESHCVAPPTLWIFERVIRMGASFSWAFAFSAFWTLGNYDVSGRLDLDASDGRCGVADYMGLLQCWSVAVPLLVVVPAFLWIGFIGRQPGADITFAIGWVVTILPVIWGELRLLRASHVLRIAYRRQVRALGSYSAQQTSPHPTDPTEGFLGAHFWAPASAAIALFGTLWALIEWSGGGQALRLLIP
jgi:hypothetical protein